MRTAFFLVLLLITTPRLVADPGVVDFNSSILPLLSNTCFQCHGPDEANREADLRLDQREAVFAELDSGERAVAAGDRKASVLFQRISADDPDQRMPPPDSGKSLSQSEIDLIGKWIDQGASWSSHWALIPPRRTLVPDEVAGWEAANSVDRYIHEKLQEHDLAPEARATKETLIRRATLDLTGLPPKVREVDDFLSDTSKEAFERVLDRLLNSHRYGEHMARIWLDAARYADTHGLHLDNERQIWPYRDWVIQAFNDNMPFDQFTVEQLAGDLLPNPTLAQRVATGFNRCNVTTSEGGSIDEEYYVRYAVDRVETTSTVWLGLTAGCAACHDHKFDPLTQREFYQLFSYFFSLTEKAMDGNALLPPPAVKVPSPIQLERKADLERQLAEVRREIEATLDRIDYVDALAGTSYQIETKDVVWFDDQLPEGAELSGDGEQPWNFVAAPEHPVFSGKTSTLRTAEELGQHLFQKAKNTLDIGAHDRLFTYVYLDPKNPPQTIQLQFNDGSWEHRAYWGADKGHAKGKKDASNRHLGDLPEPGKWVRLEVTAGDVGLGDGAKLNGWAFTQFAGTVYWDKAGLVSVSPLDTKLSESLSTWEQFQRQVRYPQVPDEIQKLLDVKAADRSQEQTRELTRYFLRHVSPSGREQLSTAVNLESDLIEQIADNDKAIPSSLVMEDREEPRQAHILERGQYTEPREKVSSRVPEWIAKPTGDLPANRLGLAQWLVDPTHPLTSRVTVNRLWQHFFGTGLVKTSEDFGVQGERPTHPELLDWLAVDFVESGWDVKRLQKLIMMSATYQQSSRVSATKLAADPENRFLSRGPRFRLDAEVIRDQALAVSGLLLPTIGGASVKPYQPAGLWKPVGFGGSNTSVFKQDTGSKLYRRSMYTFWKRTSPPPSMTAFDAPDRETCQVRRARTNTPLQALVLMNDVQFFEAARKFAERVIIHGGQSDEEKIVFAFRSVTARAPKQDEIERLAKLLRACELDFEAAPESAEQMLSAGESPRDESLNATQLAAWTMITHLILNLNEAVMKG